MQGKFESALSVLDSLSGEDPELVVRSQLERGRLLNSSGDPAAAKAWFEEALAGASNAGLEFLAIDALHMLAIVAPADDQDALNARALELASSATDPRAREWRASLLNNMGWTAFERGDLLESLQMFSRALEARLEQGKAADVLVARWCVARCLRELGRNDEALIIQLALADELRAAGKTDDYVDEELAALQQKITPDPGSA